MKRYTVLIALLFSCTDGDKARSTLEVNGYTDIRVTGYDYGACGKGDDTCTGFVAKAPNGRTVRGAVGCGYNLGGCGKGCTVRVEP